MRIVLLLGLLASFIFGNSTISVQAQDAPRLVLTQEDFGGTFTVETGTIVEVNLVFSDLHVAYNPALLQFLDYTLPEGIEGTVETGTIEPSFPGGVDGETSVATVEPATPEGLDGEETGVGTADDPIIIEPGNVQTKEFTATWRFLAIDAGETVMDLRTFYPPCPEDQPCPMMPDFMIAFNLVIKGEPSVIEPEDIEGDVVVVRPKPSEKPINVESGQIVQFKIREEPPYRVIYHPIALRLLPGEGLRFFVNPWGMTTRIGVETADGEILAATLFIKAECESCDVLPNRE
ncbi:MAG: hypothetical protein L0154_10935 [Chloroflexi bacterium]|nr:hypothetical protein [Chloroflexota bacterium]